MIGLCEASSTRGILDPRSKWQGLDSGPMNVSIRAVSIRSLGRSSRLLEVFWCSSKALFEAMLNATRGNHFEPGCKCQGTAEAKPRNRQTSAPAIKMRMLSFMVIVVKRTPRTQSFDEFNDHTRWIATLRMDRRTIYFSTFTHRNLRPIDT